MSRIYFAVVMLIGGLVFVPVVRACDTKSEKAAAAEKLGWRLGAQAWTFNRMTFFEAVDIISEVGMEYVEMYPGQRVSKDIKAKTGPGMSDEVMVKIKDKLKSSGVKLVNFGVTGLPGNEKKCRRVFEWAKKMGIETIVSEPRKKDLPMIDKLAREYEINVAIHNHPKPSRYWNPDTVSDACKGLSKRIGACADTGHWVRSGVDPLEALKKLEGRIISLHFKDLNRRGRRAHDVPWGTGACNAEAMLTELKHQGFEGVFSMEYEAKWTKEDLAKCVKFFHAQCEKLAGQTKSSQCKGQWISLFDGKSLDKWDCKKGGWHVEDGVIAWRKKAGFLWSKQKYGNFVLDLEFKLAKKTNSGVFIRTASRKHWLNTGIEVQILDSARKKNLGKHDCGAIYDCMAPSKNAVKEPGKWNRMIINCRDNIVRVELNGEQIIDMDLNRWTKPHQNPDGSKNKFKNAYRDMPRKGYIGFQDHKKPVWFRNIRIKPFD